MSVSLVALVRDSVVLGCTSSVDRLGNLRPLHYQIMLELRERQHDVPYQFFRLRVVLRLVFVACLEAVAVALGVLCLVLNVCVGGCLYCRMMSVCLWLPFWL